MSLNFWQLHKGINFRPQTSAPVSPSEGDVYYDSTLLKLRCYQNGAWVNLSDTDGTILLDDGSAGSPSLAFTNDTTTGLYRHASGQVGFTSGGVATVSIYQSSGDVVLKDRGAAGKGFYIQKVISDGLINISAGTGSGNGANIWLYGSAHANVNKIAFNQSAAEVGSITGSGLWTFGPSGSTQSHVVNGSLQLLAATANNSSIQQTGRVAGASTQSQFQQFYNDGSTTREITRWNSSSTNATASLSGGLLRIGTSTGAGTMTYAFQIDNTQALTLGASGGTQTHVVNGQLLTTSYVGIGAVDSSKAFAISGTGLITGLNVASGSFDATAPIGATASVVGVRARVRTSAATALGFAFEALQAVVTGAPTILVNYYGSNLTSGTNNAFIADNQSFTGNWFINSSTTNPSHFSGPMDWDQIATPSNPASGSNRVYFKSDGNLYKLSSAGVETVLGGDINNGGNSFGSAMTIGTNDANALNLETSNTTRMTLNSTGEIYSPSTIWFGNNSSLIGAQVEVYKNPGADATSQALYARGSNNFDGVVGQTTMGFFGETVRSLTGVTSRTDTQAHLAAQFRTQWIVTNSGIVLTHNGTRATRTVDIAPAVLSGAGSLALLDFVKLNIQTDAVLTGTNKYGIYMGTMSGATNNWQLYIAGTSPSYHAGALRIGTGSVQGAATEKFTVVTPYSGTSTDAHYGSFGLLDINTGDSLSATQVNHMYWYRRTVAASSAVVETTSGGAGFNMNLRLGSSFLVPSTSSYTYADSEGFAELAIRDMLVTGGGGTLAITHYKKIFITADAVATGTNKYGLYIDSQSGATNNWQIYSTGTAPSYFAGPIQLAVGSAAAPSITFTGDTDTGIFKSSTNSPAIAAGGNTVAVFSAVDANFAAIQLGNGQTATYAAQIFMARSDSILELLSDTGSGTAAQIYLYGGTHATKAKVTEFRVDSTIMGSINANGLWTLGASGNTSTHTVNGPLFTTVPGSAEVRVTSTASNSSAQLGIIVNTAATTADPFMVFNDSANGAGWAVGRDTSDSNKLKISQGASIGTNDYFAITTAGSLTLGASSGTVGHIVNGNSLGLEGTNAGLPVVLKARNNTTTSNSDAQLYLITNSTSGGDAYVRFESQQRAINWVAGTDGTDSDSFKICASNTIGTTPRYTITTGGTHTFNGVFEITGGGCQAYPTISGQTASISVFNQSDTASSAAMLGATVGGSSASDPYLKLSVQGFNNWTLGIRNNDVDALHLSLNSTPGAGNGPTMRFDTTNERIAIKSGALTTGAVAKVGGVIRCSSPSNQNSGSGETDLVTGTLKGGSLSVNGDSITYRWRCSGGANANSKTIRIYLGTTVLQSVTTTGNGTVLIGEVVVSRDGSNSQRVGLTAFEGTTCLQNSITTTALTDSSDQTVKITGQGTATGDLNCYLFKVDWCPAS